MHISGILQACWQMSRVNMTLGRLFGTFVTLYTPMPTVYIRYTVYILYINSTQLSNIRFGTSLTTSAFGCLHPGAVVPGIQFELS
jgi:hypothetical protein